MEMEKWGGKERFGHCQRVKRRGKCKEENTSGAKRKKKETGEKGYDTIGLLRDGYGI